MASPALRPNPPTPLSSLNVLVVDDNEANRIAFETLLTGLGFTVHLADSGQRALQLASQFHFAVILTDVRMPIMDGVETAVQLRRNPLTRGTPIIFVSAHEGTAVEAARADLNGMVDYIFSPVDPEVLKWKVQNWADVYIKNELLRRRAVNLKEAHHTLHELIMKSPVSEKELRELEGRLSTVIHGLLSSISDRLGAPLE